MLGTHPGTGWLTWRSRSPEVQGREACLPLPVAWTQDSSSVQVGTGPGVRPGFRSQLCHLPTGQSWLCALISIKFSFLVYEMGLSVPI